MIERKNIEKILAAGVKAPSGDNSQPWRFEIHGDAIDVYNLPDCDNPILNYEQRGSYIAHGALIENMVITATTFGYSANAVLFPDSHKKTLIARISFTSKTNQQDPLAAYIDERHTNRRAYEDAPLTAGEISALSALPALLESENVASLRFVFTPKEKIDLARAASSIEEVVLENRALHELLFKDVTWTKRQEQTIHRGLYLAAMEFVPPQKAIFWLASHWPIMKILNIVGLSRFIAKEDAKLYATGAGFVAVLLEKTRPADFILAGRLMQRLWLTATSLGIFAQPVTALLFAHMRANSDAPAVFSEKHRAAIETNYATVARILSVDGKTPAMLLRIGHAEPPSAYSTRKDPVAIFF